MTADVVVIGAGAAGLAAARMLSGHGASVAVLEARDRIGGRLLTREDPALPIPVDLGGEFIHGAVPETFALLRAANTVAIDTAGTSFAYEDGELRVRDDPFDITARVVSDARNLREDMSVEAFLRTLGDGANAERERRYTRLMVEGFDAADPAVASICAIAAEWGDASGQTSQQFRPLGGYARVMRALHGALDPARVQVSLSTMVHAIRREQAGVRVDATGETGTQLSLEARAAIVTLPVGVLKANAVRFEPALPQPKLDALEKLLMGPVVRLVLRFRTAFWERVHGGKFREGSFFLRADGSFPAIWTLLPLRVPILNAWAGGPKAAALERHDERALIATALQDMRVLFGDEIDPAEELEAVYTHDWQRDPCSRGAYSYVAVGGIGARAALAAPVDGVLFFAGEATSPFSEAGTVGGALQTGERAAREVLAALRFS